jgi:hypothetical protein
MQVYLMTYMYSWNIQGLFFQTTRTTYSWMARWEWIIIWILCRSKAQWHTSKYCTTLCMIETLKKPLDNRSVGEIGTWDLRNMKSSWTSPISSVFIEWEMFHTKFVEKIKTYILCSITFFRNSCRLWDNVEKYGTARQVTDDNIIWSMRFACWVTKATDTHSVYVILTAFPRQKWLCERVSMLRFTYMPVLFLCSLLCIQPYLTVPSHIWLSICRMSAGGGTSRAAALGSKLSGIVF